MQQTPCTVILLWCIAVTFTCAFVWLLASQQNIEYVKGIEMTSLDALKSSNQVQIDVTEGNAVISNVVKVPVNTHNCTQWFEDTMEANLDVIKKYPRGDADMYLSNISGDSQTTKRLMTSFPVIVTAASSAYYGVTQGLLKSIHELLIPKYNEIKIIYYDMGLTDSQRTQLVQVEYKWVWWADGSIRFLTNQLDLALDYSKDNSLLFFTNDVGLSVAYQTDTQTMKYFGEDTCKYRHFGEFEAGFVLFYSDHVTDIIVDQWAACAVNEACMAPPGTRQKLQCRRHEKWDGRCHRFD